MLMVDGRWWRVILNGEMNSEIKFIGRVILQLAFYVGILYNSRLAAEELVSVDDDRSSFNPARKYDVKVRQVIIFRDAHGAMGVGMLIGLDKAKILVETPVINCTVSEDGRFIEALTCSISTTTASGDNKFKFAFLRIDSSSGNVMWFKDREMKILIQDLSQGSDYSLEDHWKRLLSNKNATVDGVTPAVLENNQNVKRVVVQDTESNRFAKSTNGHVPAEYFAVLDNNDPINKNITIKLQNKPLQYALDFLNKLLKDKWFIQSNNSRAIINLVESDIKIIDLIRKLSHVSDSVITMSGNDSKIEIKFGVNVNKEKTSDVSVPKLFDAPPLKPDAPKKP